MVQQLFSERIEWEWKIFKQEMMMTSKENVFMLAKTIFPKTADLSGSEKAGVFPRRDWENVSL